MEKGLVSIDDSDLARGIDASTIRDSSVNAIEGSPREDTDRARSMDGDDGCVRVTTRATTHDDDDEDVRDELSNHRSPRGTSNEARRCARRRRREEARRSGARVEWLDRSSAMSESWVPVRRCGATVR